jgi:hypothetical protein
MAERALQKPKRTAAELRALVKDPDVYEAFERERYRLVRKLQREDVAELKAEIAAGRKEQGDLDLIRTVHKALARLHASGRRNRDIGPTVGSA